MQATDPQDTDAQAAARLPLAGVRVVECTQVLAGPFASTLLGELGADVIKVETPDGDMFRAIDDVFGEGESGYFYGVNRSKRSIVLDLKDPDDRSRFDELIRGADVFLVAFRPRVTEQLGLTAQHLRRINPRLVHVSVTAFGERGPLAEEPGMDLLTQSLSGLMALIGEPDGSPMKVGPPVSDYLAGMQAAFSVVAALRGRERDGTGERIELSLLQQLVAGLGAEVVAGDLLGRASLRSGRTSAHRVPAGSFDTADAPLVLTCRDDAEAAALCRALGHPEWTAEPRWATAESRRAERRAVEADVAAALATATRDAWLPRLAAAGVPSGPLHPLREALADDQVTAERLIVPLVHPVAGPYHVIDLPVRFDGVPAGARGRGPQLGEHTDEVVAALGRAFESGAPTGVGAWHDPHGDARASGAPHGGHAPEPNAPPDAGPRDPSLAGSDTGRPPLADLRVLDLTDELAGSHAASLLADQGADVVKVEPPGGCALRVAGAAAGGDAPGFVAFARTCRSVVIDEGEPAGRARLAALLDAADVVLVSGTPTSLARRGLDAASARRGRPRLVHGMLTPHGAAGPRVEQPGDEVVAQGLSGIMALTGEPDGPAMPSPLPLASVATGTLLALGVVAALRARDRGEDPPAVSMSVFAGAMALVSNFVPSCLDGGRDMHRSGVGHAQIVPYQVFATADEDVVLACLSDRFWPSVCAALERPDWQDDPRFATNQRRVDHRAEIVGEVAEVLAGHGRAHWLKRLAAHDVPCAPINTLEQMLSDPQVLAEELITTVEDRRRGSYRVPRTPVRFGDRPLVEPRPAPALGAHSEEVAADWCPTSSGARQ